MDETVLFKTAQHLEERMGGNPETVGEIDGFGQTRTGFELTGYEEFSNLPVALVECRTVPWELCGIGVTVRINKIE